MPFRSKAQERWMWKTHPDMAKRWEKETPDDLRKKLPQHVKKTKKTARKAKKKKSN